MKKITKILVSTLLVLCMLLSMVPMVSAAGEAESDVSYYTGDQTAITAAYDAFKAGSKTAINSADEFVGFAKASHEVNFSGKTITLEKDLVFNVGNAVDWMKTAPTQYPNWVAVGKGAGTGSSTDTGFQGVFDGKKHVISGVYINQTDGDDGFHGVFECLAASATIKDVAVVNSYITSGDNYFAALVGRAWNAANVTISGCYVNAILTGGDSTSTSGISGFVGHNSASNLVIDNCVFAGVIYEPTISSRMGAFLGFGGEYNSNFKVTVKDCANLGYIKSLKQWAGALVGTANNIVIERSMNYGYSYSSNSLTNTLIGSLKANTGLTKGFTVTDGYIFNNNKKLVTANESDYTTYSSTISVQLADVSDFTGKKPTTYANWTVRSGKLSMPTTAYTNFAKYIDVFETELKPTNFVNDSFVQFNAGKDVIGKRIASLATSFNIDSEDEFIGIVSALNTSWITNSTSGLTFNLTRDMTFNEGNAKDWATTAPAFAWTPINDFRGTFDGDGHTISGIYLDAGNTYFKGFISVLSSGARVQNVGFVNSYFTASSEAYTPSIIGRINAKNVKLNGIYSEIIVEGKAAAGGIVGLLTNVDATTTISNCVFAGTINSTWYGGGIVGQGGLYLNSDGGIHTVNLEDCANIGTVNASYAGALIGVASKANIVRCANFGTVISTEENYVNNALIADITTTNTATLECILTNTYLISDRDQCVFANTDNATEFVNTAVATSVTSAQAKGEAAKGDADTDELENMEALFDSGNWTARSKTLYDEYPLPTVIYENFFKVTLKFLQSTDVDTNTNKYSVRVVARIDSDNYQKVGFKVIVHDSVNGSWQLKKDYSEFTYVYKTLKGKTGEGYETITAPGSTYYAAISITNLPTTVTSIEIQPYTIGGGEDADTYEYTYGDAKTLGFENGNYTGLITD